MKKYDVIFMICVLMIAASISIWYSVLARQEAGQIRITVDHQIYGNYLLNVDQKVKINDTNILVIENNFAYMKEATCPNKDCIHQKEISKKGETITCLPNKVIVEVIDGEQSELDAVAN